MSPLCEMCEYLNECYPNLMPTEIVVTCGKFKRWKSKVISMPASKPQTNAARIRAMTDEELAMLLGAPTIVLQPWCNMDYDCPYIDQDPARCDLCALGWLKREVSDGT